MSVETRTLGGCVRLDPAGPYWHVNGTHTTIGLDTSTAPRIVALTGELEFDVLEGFSVVSMTTQCDETLTAAGISAGPSGGLGPTRIRMHHKTTGRLWLNQAAHYALAADPYANLWLTVVVQVEVPDPDPEPDPLTVESPELAALIDQRIADALATIPDPSTSLLPATYNDMASLRRVDVTHLKFITDQMLAQPPSEPPSEN